MGYREREKEGMKLSRDVPVCRYFVHRNCRDPPHAQSLAADGPMYHNLWGGMGGPGVCALFLLVAMVGIYREYLRSKKEARPGRLTPEKLDVSLPKRKQDKQPWWQACLQSVMHFWTERMTFTMPVLSLKLYLTVLVVMDLLVLTAPHLVPLATPEVVALNRGYPSGGEPQQPNTAIYLLPNLTKDSIDAVVFRLQVARTLVLLSWSAFLLTPKFEGITYSVGTILYTYLGVLGHNYVKQNAMMPSLLFMFCTIPAVPWIRGNNPRVAAWLRTSLLVAILLPMYYCAGLSKIRYMGILHNFSGHWISEVLSKHVRKYRVSFRQLTKYVAKHNVLPMAFSLGNLVFEIIIPILLMAFPDSVLFRNIFLVMGVGFHCSIIVIMGANFMSSAVLCFLCLDPLSWCFRGKTQPQQEQFYPLPKAGDWFRVTLSLLMVIFAIRPAIVSDLVHLSGKVGHDQYYDPKFPFSEWKMYAKPLFPSFHISLGIAVFSIVLFGYSMAMSGRRDKIKGHLRIVFLSLMSLFFEQK